MALIPQYQDPTLQAMRKATEDAQRKSGKRNYVGASGIGNACKRAVWYSYKLERQTLFDAATLWRFEDGHRTEDIIAERLRAIPGIQLKTHDENGKQYGFSMFEGRFAGHCDGVILGLLQAPKKKHVWENKATSEKKLEEFRKLKAKHGEKNALKQWNETYYYQAQLYMHFMQIDRHYLTVCSAGARDIESCRTDYNPDDAENAIHKAQEILVLPYPPERISENDIFWLCRFCDFRKECGKSEL